MKPGCWNTRADTAAPRLVDVSQLCDFRGRKGVWCSRPAVEGRRRCVGHEGVAEVYPREKRRPSK